jgi:hypothetical protein
MLALMLGTQALQLAFVYLFVSLYIALVSWFLVWANYGPWLAQQAILSVPVNVKLTTRCLFLSNVDVFCLLQKDIKICNTFSV